MRRLRLLTATILAVGMTACSAVPRTGPTSPARTVTGDDLIAAGAHSAMDGLPILRLRGTRGHSLATLRRPEGGGVVVYLDGARLMRPETLREVHPRDVATMEYLDPSSATIRFGTGHTGGALLVRTRIGR